MKKIITIVLISILSFTAKAQHTIVLKHSFYEIVYDTVFHQGILNHYTQTLTHYNQLKTNKIVRSGSELTEFHQDELLPKVMQGFVTAKDYADYNKQYNGDKHNTMDVGHIVPFEPMTFDSSAAKSTMKLQTNTALQISFFNEHQWAFIEKRVLDSIGSKYNAEVFTGVLISFSHPHKWHNSYIPDYYWKVAVYNGTIEAWLGLNKSDNTSTNPTDCNITVSSLKTIIKQYYPNISLPF